MLAGYASICPSEFPAICFLSPYPTHASGSHLIVQLVSDRLAARHVAYFMCPCCSDVC
jgi:hypothetical protein